MDEIIGINQHFGKKDIKNQLKFLPKFICYKAALLREKMLLSYCLFFVSTSFLILLGLYRYEVYWLQHKLREKEFILAPGVRDFTTVSPQSIPDSYIQDAVTDFVATLGNVNASNIEERYASLKRFMSDRFQIQFDLATKHWIDQVVDDDIAQLLMIQSKTISTDSKGVYEVVVHGKAEFYSSGQLLGDEDQVIEMKLSLVPPDRGRRWYLQIDHITWSR